MLAAHVNVLVLLLSVSLAGSSFMGNVVLQDLAWIIITHSGSRLF
jgi:hypothetical protein